MQTKALEKYLDDWQTRGFLTVDQVNRIREFEQGRAGGSKLMLALTLLAIFSIGLGVISLIANNWDLIPAWLKLLSYFTLMGVQAFFIVRADKKSGIEREPLHFLYMLSIFAGIALIAQVFHVPSDGWRGLALWAALGFAVMLRARVWYPVLFWYGSFTAAWLGWVSSGGSNSGFQRWEIFMLVVAAMGLLAGSRRFWTLPDPQRRVTILLSSFFVLIVGPWCLGLIMREVEGGLHRLDLVAVMVCSIIGFLLLKLSTSQRLLALIIILAFAGRMALSLEFGDNMWKGASNAGEGLLFFLQLSGMSLLALQGNENRLFDIMTLMMAARILSVFFTVLGSLFMTGAGLILFGVLVLVLLRVWYRYHERLQVYLKEILP